MSSWLLLLLVVAAAVTGGGCVAIAGKVATRLATHDVNDIEQDFKVFEADLALFRKCLKKRGGSCQGSDTTPLAHSSQAASGQSVAAVQSGASTTLASSVSALPAGHPAKAAHGVLSHPVVRQAAALYDHLRGHDVGAQAPGVSVASAQGSDGGAESTVTMDMKLDQVQGLHQGLMSSIGTTAWESLHDHCKGLLAQPENSADRHLAADCRRAAFIHGYLGAYFRHGEFVEVDVQLAAAIQALNDGTADLEGKIQDLENQIDKVKTDIHAAETKDLANLATDASGVGSEVKRLLEEVKDKIAEHLGPEVADLLDGLSTVGAEAAVAAEKLAQAADQDAAHEIEQPVADLDKAVVKLDADLEKLKVEVAAVDQELVGDVNDELTKADKKLSNVFKVSNVGFVSRDSTFVARLPTLEVTLDPTAKHLITVTDLDTRQVLTGKSDFANLGVATDTSGVGTGASIGAEMVRVFLEAIFDAHEGLPAVAPANQPNLKATGLTLGELSLPLFQSPTGNVDSQDFTHMTHFNSQVASKTQVILSRIIAGIGPFSLNNRPLEDFIVEMISTSVRKAAEKATWCWYACNLNVDIATLESDAGTAVKDKVKEEEARVKAAAEKAEHKVKTWVHQEAEQVKLKFRLSR